MYSSIGMFEWIHGRKGLAMGSGGERETSLLAIHGDGQALPIVVDVDHLQRVAWQQQQQRTQHGNDPANDTIWKWPNKEDFMETTAMVSKGEWMQRSGTPSAGGSALPPRWQGSWAPASQSWCHVLLSCLFLDERKKHGQDIKHTLIVVNIHLKTTRIQHALHGSALPFLPWQNYEQVFMLCWLHECLCAWPSLQCHKPVTQCTNMHMHDICPQQVKVSLLIDLYPILQHSVKTWLCWVALLPIHC